MNYNDFIKRELITAFGCTEPIALAYGAAVAKDILGENPVLLSTRKCTTLLIKLCTTFK
jgi:L-cysteine desulfidase